MANLTDPRQMLEDRLPFVLQPFITWLSGIPSAQQKQIIAHTSLTVMMTAMLSIALGFALTHLSLTAPFDVAWAVYLLGFCFTTGGMRRFDVLIIHQSLHNRVFKKPSHNQLIGNAVSLFLLRTPYIQNRAGHMGHHRAPCDEEDEDVIFLKRAGIITADTKAELLLRLALICASPKFHINFFLRRLQTNLGHNASPARKIATSIYLACLVTPVATSGMTLLFPLMAYWVAPLIIGFQISNFLYTCTKHRWWIFNNVTTTKKEDKDRLSFARVCCSQPPNEGDLKGWIAWWLSVFFIHLPTRLFIIVGDTVQHDLHHIAPTCDWPNSAFERRKYKLQAPHRFSEVWGGIWRHLQECNLTSENQPRRDSR